jgi:hypothetical protein
MKTFSIHITPPRGWPVRHEIPAHTADQAADIARALFPNCTFGKPRDVSPPGYTMSAVCSISGRLYDRMPRAVA